jgi:hypothetical protein
MSEIRLGAAMLGLALATGCSPWEAAPAALAITITTERLADGWENEPPYDDSPWKLEVVATRPPGAVDDADHCPGPTLSGTTMNGSEPDRLDTGGWNNGGRWSAGWCSDAVASWNLDAAPDAVDLDLGSRGAYLIALPVLTLERIEPEEGRVSRDGPIRLDAVPPLGDDAQVGASSHGNSIFREPYPYLSCWTEAWVEDGVVVGVADIDDDIVRPELVEPECTIGVTVTAPAVALTPCEDHSCTLRARVVHREAVVLDGF